MNKRYIFIILTVIVAIIAGLFLKGFSATNNATLGGVPKDSVAIGGWVEVLSGKAFLIENKEGADVKKGIATGDAVTEGNILETDDRGKSAVHFFDGSVLRVNPSTRFAVKSAEYNKASGKLTVKASLSFGKVWSKIIDLATPDSLWQVETSNTVATVRGSAFGVSSDGKNSKIFGSQHKVTVEVVDPKTKEKLKIQPLFVSEGSFLKINDTDIQKIKSIEEKARIAAPSERESIMRTALLVLVPMKIDEKIKSDEWFNGNETEDKKIDEEIKKTKEETGDNKVEFRKAFNKKAEDKLVEEKSKIETPLKEETKKEEPVKMIELQKAPEKWNSLSIETRSNLSDLVEEDIVTFKAVLHGDGGTSKDVTGEAKWKVYGQMGSIGKPGIFSAKLDPLISELGEGEGFVGATWEEVIGEKMSAKSGLIHVTQKIESTIENG